VNGPLDGPAGTEAAADETGTAGKAGTPRMARTLPVEVELKYDVTDRSSLDPVLDAAELAGFAGGDWRELLVEDRYVDTPGRAVERAGYAARLRFRGDRTILGLKSLTPAAGALHRREEMEAPVSEGLEPRSWPPSDARDLLLGVVGDEPIRERFLVRQRRRVRLVSAPDGTAEISADEVEIEAEGRSLGRYSGVEVELRSGDEQILGRLAAALEATGGVTPSTRSKFEIARELAEPAPAPNRRPRRAHRDRAAATTAGTAGTAGGDEGAAGTHAAAAQRPAQEAIDRLLASVGKSPGVTADDAFAEAGRKVLRFHLARMLAAEPGTRSGEDPEDLHKMRVATRRMRAAWRVFGDGFRRSRVRRSVAGLRTLAALLGTVRDLDVLIDALEAYAARLEPSEHEELRPLVEAWRRERQRARTALLRHLDSAGYRRFVEEHLAFVEAVGRDAIPGGPTDPRRVRDTAPSRLWTAYEGVRAYDGVLRWADLATLHQLRIAGKRLRYAIEFFREPLGADAGMLVERVTGLQDHLGLLHDADVAAGLARSFLVERSALLRPASVDAVGRYLADREREAARLRRTVGPVWRRVTSIEFRRALGRATAQL
jgi:CHAD domain-containing protein